MMGRSAETERAARTASRSSIGLANVSRTSRSTPASRSASICSTKMARASSGVIVPIGPSGWPMLLTEPARKTGSPLTSRASRAILTPRKLTSRTRCSRPYAARATRLAAKVLVSMTSAPAAMYARWTA